MNRADPDQTTPLCRVVSDVGFHFLPCLVESDHHEKTCFLHTVKFLNFRKPENFAVIYLKFMKRGQTLGYFILKMQME